jgi:hypothetical protein
MGRGGPRQHVFEPILLMQCVGGSVGRFEWVLSVCVLCTIFWGIRWSLWYLACLCICCVGMVDGCVVASVASSFAATWPRGCALWELCMSSRGRGEGQHTEVAHVGFPVTRQTDTGHTVVTNQETMTQPLKTHRVGAFSTDPEREKRFPHTVQICSLR